MSQQVSEPKSSFAADSLAIGMLVMLAMTIVQRGLGFFRGIWFCRLLDDTVVGQWAMALGFITLISPVMLLGLPGSLPRYVERYRIDGHLPALVRRLLLGTIVCGGLFSALMLGFPEWFGWLIFLQPQQTSLIYSVGGAVVVTIGFNFVHQLVSSLRQVRVASLMQFIQSLAFTGSGVGWLVNGGSLEGLILCYAGATLVAIAPGGWSLATGWAGLPTSDESFDAPSMWRRLLPYAAALWVMNLLTNVFELSDRYMILHLSPGGELVGQASVGQYHSGRIVPVLLMSLATMVAGVLMPYLSADWENGSRDAVRDRLRKILLAVSASFTAGSAVALTFAPWLFGTLLEDRYTDGLAVMPLAFVFCTWASLATIAQNYLWVAEKGKYVAIAVAIGLLFNLGLNFLLLPIWGLSGAVVATLASHGVVLLGVWVAMAKCGYRLDQTTICMTLLPATLLAGPIAAIICVAGTLSGNGQARAWIRDTWRDYLGNLISAPVTPASPVIE